jgi:hypothetical protein
MELGCILNMIITNKINFIQMLTENKRLAGFFLIGILVLLMPLIAMQFSTNVNWDVFDFIIAGTLLFGTSLLLELVLRKINKKHYRVILFLIIISLLILTWIELAVGIFGTPFAGS